MNRDEAIEKVKKLLKVTTDNGAGLGETLTAAARAQRLIEQFEIDQVLLSTKENKPEVEDISIVEEVVYEFKGPRVLTWALNLLGALGDVNGCRTWYASAGNWKGSHGKLKGAGRSADLATIRYMMQYLCNEVERLCDDASRRERAESGACNKTWTNSFKLGAVGEIGSRIRQEHAKAREEAKNPELAYKRAIECGDTERVLELDRAPKYELAVIDAALAKLDERRKRADEWAEEKYKGTWTHVSRTGSKSYGAYAKGREAGRSVNLGGGHKRLNG